MEESNRDPGGELLTTVRHAHAEFPRASAVSEELLATAGTLLGGQLRELITRHGRGFWTMAERLIGLADRIGGDPVESLVEYTFVTLKEQALFLQTQEYSNSNFEEVASSVYHNPEVMGKFYLEGLMLTHAFWAIHYDMHAFFASEFLPKLPNEGRGAEFGFGHGLYLLEILNRQPKLLASGFDISSFSIDYAAKLLNAGGIASQRYDLSLCDVRSAIPIPDATFSWLVFAEIIEHIPDPLFALKELRRLSRAGTPLFATTVVNANAIDHLYLFREVDEVRELLDAAGFRIVAEKVFAVSDYSTSLNDDPSVDIAVVCVPK